MGFYFFFSTLRTFIMRFGLSVCDGVCVKVIKFEKKKKSANKIRERESAAVHR